MSIPTHNCPICGKVISQGYPACSPYTSRERSRYSYCYDLQNRADDLARELTEQCVSDEKRVEILRFVQQPSGECSLRLALEIIAKLQSFWEKEQKTTMRWEFLSLDVLERVQFQAAWFVERGYDFTLRISTVLIEDPAGSSGVGDWPGGGVSWEAGTHQELHLFVTPEAFGEKTPSPNIGPSSIRLKCL